MVKYTKLVFQILILNLVLSGFLFSEKVCWNCKRINHDNSKYCIDCYTDITKVSLNKKVNSKKENSFNINKENDYNEDSLIKKVPLTSKYKIKKYFKTIYFLYFLIFISFLKILSRIIVFIRNFLVNWKWGKTKKEYLEYKQEKEKKLNIEHQKSVELIHAFKVLGLTVGSSLNQVAHAYKEMLEKYHIDAENKLNEEIQIENIKKLEEINNAYDLLKRIYKLK